MWLYVPGLESCRSAPASEGSTSVCTWPSGAEPSVTSSGTASPRPFSWPGWRTRTWIALLCGTISAPSRASSTATAWISSLEASPASPTASPDGSLGCPTSATCGPTSGDSSEKSALPHSSSKTSADSFGMVCLRFWKTLPPQGGMRSGRVCERRMLARRTDESASSSSRGMLWPTPDASVMQDTEGIETWMARRARIKAQKKNGNGMGTPLAMAAKLWATPTAHDGRRPGADRRSTQGANLSRDAAHGHPALRTPTAGGDGSARAVLNLRFVATLMGLPQRWCEIETTPCAASETPSCRSKRRSQSESSCAGVAAR